MDQYGHPAEHFNSEEEIKYYDILEQFNIHLQLDKQILINEIFITAIRKEKLNLHVLMAYFENNSWYGKNINKKISENNTITYNWLNLLAPAINEYFTQIFAFLKIENYHPNFVLAIDSLTLKIEGLVRDICMFSDVTTFFQTKDKNRNNIVREKDINALLREDPIKELFDEDDLLFFKFVLVEKAGLNLRHKVAHCLLDFSEYHLNYMHLLLIVVLKLGRYDFVKTDQAVEEKVAESDNDKQ